MLASFAMKANPHNFDEEPSERGEITHNVGTLQIKIFEAKLTRNTCFVGEMSPFAVIQWKKKKYRTKVLKNAG